LNYTRSERPDLCSSTLQGFREYSNERLVKEKHTASSPKLRLKNKKPAAEATA